MRSICSVVPGNDRVHGVAPLVLDDVEVGVADAAEEHLDRHVVVPLNPEEHECHGMFLSIWGYGFF